MTEEKSKQYDAQRKKIESMTHGERMARLEEISTEVFIMANSFAGGKGLSGIATSLHESANHIMQAQKIFEGKAEPGIPASAITRACGFGGRGMTELLMDMNIPANILNRYAEPGMGTSLMDLQLKDEEYREDLENESNED